MTPDEFKTAMQDIASSWADDTEILHAKMDELMCALLVSLGYNEGVRVFCAQRKWYA